MSKTRTPKTKKPIPSQESALTRLAVRLSTVDEQANQLVREVEKRLAEIPLGARPGNPARK